MGVSSWLKHQRRLDQKEYERLLKRGKKTNSGTKPRRRREVRIAYIYALIDPRTDEIRYIGKTGDMELRLAEHIEEATRHQNTHKCYWLNELALAGFKPIMKEMEWCCYEDWEQREINWIRKLKTSGARLTNMTDGGDSNEAPYFSLIR